MSALLVPHPITGKPTVRQPRRCMSCDTVPPPHRMQAPEGYSCNHEFDVCTPCWKAWLEAQLNSELPDSISCLTCGRTLTQQDIRVLGGEEIYQRFLDLELKFFLSGDEKFRFCMDSKCPSGQIHEGGDIFKCQHCGHKHCTVCDTVWHDGLTCQEVEEERNRIEESAEAKNEEDTTAHTKKQEVEEDATKQTLEKVTKSCPGCKRNIEKNGGCEHIICTICDYEFCWLCLADYDAIRNVGNHAHNKDCRLWRPPPPRDPNYMPVDDRREWPEEGVDGMDQQEHRAMTRQHMREQARVHRQGRIAEMGMDYEQHVEMTRQETMQNAVDAMEEARRRREEAGGGVGRVWWEMACSRS